MSRNCLFKFFSQIKTWLQLKLVVLKIILSDLIKRNHEGNELLISIGMSFLDKIKSISELAIRFECVSHSVNRVRQDHTDFVSFVTDYHIWLVWILVRIELKVLVLIIFK